MWPACFPLNSLFTASRRFQGRRAPLVSFLPCEGKVGGIKSRDRPEA